MYRRGFRQPVRDSPNRSPQPNKTDTAGRNALSQPIHGPRLIAPTKQHGKKILLARVFPQKQ